MFSNAPPLAMRSTLTSAAPHAQGCPFLLPHLGDPSITSASCCGASPESITRMIPSPSAYELLSSLPTAEARPPATSRSDPSPAAHEPSPKCPTTLSSPTPRYHTFFPRISFSYCFGISPITSPSVTGPELTLYSSPKTISVSGPPFTPLFRHNENKQGTNAIFL